MRLHDCGKEATRRQVPAALSLVGGWHRFLTVEAFNAGFRVGDLPVAHHARRFGTSRYGLGRYVRFARDLAVTCARLRPARRASEPLPVQGTLGSSP